MVAVLVMTDAPKGVDRFAVAVIVTVFATLCGAAELMVTNFVICPAVNVTAAGANTTVGSLLVNENVSPLVDARLSCKVNDELTPARIVAGEMIMLSTASG